MEMTDVNLSEVADKVLTDLRQQEPERNVISRVQSGLNVKGDQRLLFAAIENLLRNAWKYSSKKQQSLIEFGVEDKGNERVFFVKDNGAGFETAYAHKLFVPFERLHHKSEFTGSGVGLFNVQRIIQRHNGRIWAESKVGEGAQFYFTIETPET
jgi:light-regulated signal transduction histidine kinase (bacteriophytochrome)